MLQRKPDKPHRVAIEAVRPQVDCGRFPVKRTPGDTVQVTADIFGDGHDIVRAALRYREVDGAGAPLGDWVLTPMQPEVNDHWHGTFTVGHVGWYEYAIDAWVDRFGTWRRDLLKKFEAKQDVASDLLEGALIVRHTAARARRASSARRKKGTTPAPASEASPAGDADWMLAQADLVEHGGDQAARVSVALDPALQAAVARHAEHAAVTSSEPVLRVIVEPVRARFGAWYEMFPRSAGPDPNILRILGLQKARAGQPITGRGKNPSKQASCRSR
jgi:starch synthase (maltosyl-transferring)